jgi:GDP-4-dehydro-6-deoxy-D-mannose reductase
MKILVTGASGCLGRLLLDHLHTRLPPYEVWSSSRATLDRPLHVPCDLAKEADIDRLIERTRPDVVFHLAGSFTGDYASDFAVNADAARHLLDALRRHRLRTRVALIGSAAEYGIVRPEDNPISESRALRPMSLYGTSKAYQTLLAGHYASQHGMDVVVARLFNLFATGLSERLFVGRVERQIREIRAGTRQAVEIGDLSAQRDYINGVDAVQALMTIAARGAPGEVYNIGSGAPTTMRDLLARMLQEAGLDFAVVRESRLSSSRSGYDLPVIYADTNRTGCLARSPALFPELQ